MTGQIYRKKRGTLTRVGVTFGTYRTLSTYMLYGDMILACMITLCRTLLLFVPYLARSE